MVKKVYDTTKKKVFDTTKKKVYDTTKKKVFDTTKKKVFDTTKPKKNKNVVDITPTQTENKVVEKDEKLQELLKDEYVVMKPNEEPKKMGEFILGEDKLAKSDEWGWEDEDEDENYEYTSNATSSSMESSNPFEFLATLLTLIIPVGVVLMVGFLVLSQVKVVLQEDMMFNTSDDGQSTLEALDYMEKSFTIVIPFFVILFVTITGFKIIKIFGGGGTI